MLSQPEAQQQQHYNALANSYQEHYGDQWSRQYRDEHIHAHLVKGISLDGAHALDAMCGLGEVSQYLLDRGAHVIGVDISEEMLTKYRANLPRATAQCCSILATDLPSESFDLIAIVGGLHHLHPHLEEALHEFYRLLKPGGYLCFAEPHAHSLPDTLRNIWYRNDSLFEKNEAAIDLEYLEDKMAQLFTVKSRTYLGSIAYLLVFNSLVFRVPHWLKSLYARPLLLLERLVAPILQRRTACFVVAQWQKRTPSTT